MIRSMTGYGKAEVEILGSTCTIEARCVNGRYLELSTKIPREWSDKEGQMRETVREHVTRGSLSISVRRAESTQTTDIGPNLNVASAYVQALATIKQELSIPGEIRIEHIASLPGLFQPDSSGTEDADVWPDLQSGLIEALHALNAMRDKEGAELCRDLDERLTLMLGSTDIVEQMSVARIEAERVRLRERVRQLVEDSVVDEQRLQLEIILLSEKLDVTEECVRLRCHIKHFRQYMTGDEKAGRKLNFLLQEMNREINTIGSKCNHAEIAVIVVGVKEELERMREQVQNVE
ncbi:MAG: YicC/YloC family endoribonuclease [Ignavibacteria bacterium]